MNTVCEHIDHSVVCMPQHTHTFNGKVSFRNGLERGLCLCISIDPCEQHTHTLIPNTVVSIAFVLTVPQRAESKAL